MLGRVSLQASLVLPVQWGGICPRCHLCDGSPRSPGVSSGDICQLGEVAERLKGALRFSPAPENSLGIASKTVDISLCKEGSSFGFVLRGQCRSCPGTGRGSG